MSMHGTVGYLIRGAVVGCLCVGCMPLPRHPQDIQTRTITINTPVPVPCFTEDQRPIPPTPTAIELSTATIEQLAAAELADAIAMQEYAKQLDALFTQCVGAKDP